MSFNWETNSASIDKHTLKLEIAQIGGEEDRADNVKTVTIEVIQDSSNNGASVSNAARFKV